MQFGSIVAALGSYLQAKSNYGERLLRIEDIDIPRTQPGVTDDILHTLENLVLPRDGEPVIQSQRTKEYSAILIIKLQ